MFKRIVAVAALSLSVAAQPVWALSIVFDPSNFGQNAITAAKSALAVAKQVEAYILQGKQYLTQLQQLDMTNVAADMLGLGANYQDLQDAIRYAQQLRSLYGSLQQAQQSIDRRLTEARFAGLSFEGYMTNVARQIADGNLYQKQRVQNERRILESVKTDYEAAERFAARIPATAGAHESMALLNSQMNRFLVQNARMIEVLGVTLPQAQNKEAQDALEEQARQAAAEEKFRKEGDDANARARQAIDLIGKVR